MGEEWFIRLYSHQTTFLWLRVSHWAAELSGEGETSSLRVWDSGILTATQMDFPDASSSSCSVLCTFSDHVHFHQWAFIQECARSHYFCPLSLSHTCWLARTLKHTHAKAKIKNYWAGLDFLSTWQQKDVDRSPPLFDLSLWAIKDQCSLCSGFTNGLLPPSIFMEMMSIVCRSKKYLSYGKCCSESIFQLTCLTYEQYFCLSW